MIEQYCAETARIYHNPPPELAWKQSKRHDESTLWSVWHDGYLFFVEKHTIDKES